MYNLYGQRDTVYGGDDNFMLIRSFSSRSKAESYIHKRWPDAVKSKDEDGHVTWSITVDGSLYDLYISTL